MTAVIVAVRCPHGYATTWRGVAAPGDFLPPIEHCPVCHADSTPLDLPPPNPHHTLPRVAVATSDRKHREYRSGGHSPVDPTVYLFPHIDCAEGDCLAGARLIAVGNNTWRPPT